MRRLLSFSAMAVLVAAILPPAPLNARKADDAPFEVVRAGDRDMTCEALAAEINTLSNGPVAAKKKKSGLGFLKVLGAASPVLGMAGAGGAAASVAVGAAGAAGSAAGSPGMSTDPEQLMLKMQRKQRLTGIFDQKKC